MRTEEQDGARAGERCIALLLMIMMILRAGGGGWGGGVPRGEDDSYYYSLRPLVQGPPSACVA